MTNIKQSGRCLCGEVTYEVSAPPIHTTICHCKMCQRSTGSAYLLEPIFYVGDFSVTAGETKVYTHISDLSALALYVNFCANCGTKLFQTFERFPEALGVFGGTFDDPNWFARNPENTRHIFVDSAIKGDILPADYMLYHQHTADAVTGEKQEPFIHNVHKTVE